VSHDFTPCHPVRGRILTEKENVCVGISFPRINKNGAEKIFNAIDFLCLCGIGQCVSDAA